jgi:hypothetical protein
MPNNEDCWLTRPELAERWKVPLATLNQWGSQHRGPKYALFGRHARYRLSDVIAWEKAQFVSEPDGRADDDWDDSESTTTAEVAARQRVRAGSPSAKVLAQQGD